MKYTPDRWVIIEIDTGKEKFNKVLAGWYGGYLNGDSWKINSGNEKELEFDDRWEFYGFSGSTYVCYKNAYGMSAYMAQILAGFQKQVPKGTNIKILPEYDKVEEA